MFCPFYRASHAWYLVFWRRRTNKEFVQSIFQIVLGNFRLVLPSVIDPSMVVEFSFAVKNVYIRRTLCPILLGHILVTVPKIEKRNFPPNDPSFHFFKRILRVCKLIIGVYG